MIMLSSSVFRNVVAIFPVDPTTNRALVRRKSAKSRSAKSSSILLQSCATLRPLLQCQSSSSVGAIDENQSPRKRTKVFDDSVRVLEWDKVSDAISSYAGTNSGREASKKQLRQLDQTYDESLRLLSETNAAVEIHKYNSAILDFAGIDTLLVRSAIDRARRASTVDGQEAMAVAMLLQFSEALQSNIRVAIKENSEMERRFTPLSELILDWFRSKSLVRSILQVVNEDGSIKDSASPRLKQARWRVVDLESKLYQLMNAIISNETKGTVPLEASNVDGRWCIKSGAVSPTSFNGLLLSSGSGIGNIIEPISAVPLNDELLAAKASVAEAEVSILSDITDKMKVDIDSIENLLACVIELDVVNARASYGLSLGGTCPDLLQLDDKHLSVSSESITSKDNFRKLPYSHKKQWKLCLPKAHHPLLLQQHQRHLQKAKKDVSNVTADFRRRKMYGENINQREITQTIQMLREKVTQLEQSPPVPVDILIDKNTRVLLITGPNTGGKTICLKAVGLAAIMAKAGLYVLCSEPARMPWFDSVFADIGDDQSLSQSLSTFTGHIRQISEIQANSTSQSLVLLDEIGAGTNPLEGAALGMSILESFADSGASLTIATTHHGELKTLKYSNEGFENACMEFDEVNLKPTYKILWGVPGRSNAINIAERLGLPKVILDDARELYGTASAEIDEVILDLEKFKQEVEEYVQEAQKYFMLSKDLHEKLLNVQKELMEHSSDLRYRKMQQITEFSSKARSTLHRSLQQHRASLCQISQPTVGNILPETPVDSLESTTSSAVLPIKNNTVEAANQSSPGVESKKRMPMVGDIVQVSSLRTKAKVLKVESSKEEIVVQAGKLKLKLKLSDIKV